MAKQMDREIFEKGKDVFNIHSVDEKDLNAWVRLISSLSGQKLDWHYHGGTQCVMALGNIEKVKSTIVKYEGMILELQKKAFKS